MSRTAITRVWISVLVVTTLLLSVAAAPRSDPKPPPTFYRDVLPIFQTHCQSCHRAGGIGPMVLTAYQPARVKARAIRERVQKRIMPPWFADPCCGHFSNDPSLTEEEIATITAWADAGAPPGNPHGARSAPSWAEGWTIPQPDVVLAMPKAVAIPAAGDVEYTIPPNANNYRVEVHGTLPNDCTLLSFFPHMHLRGKRFEYNLVSNGKTETLLRVNYDFYFQLSYKLAEPRLLKAGTELQAVGWYDNSKDNPHNPAPESPVAWGDQTYNEMMVGFFDVAVPAGVDKEHFFVRH